MLSANLNPLYKLLLIVVVTKNILKDTSDVTHTELSVMVKEGLRL